ncbi:MAG: hypothetical protein PHF67_03550 [Candidatus Nanoarchaeia archaeon]|nr:hypothetical protein [Candidatus Nanoarchaeia archaeon]
MRNKNWYKKGQLTIFIILAIAIVAIVALLFMQRENLPISITPETPISQIKGCIIGNENDADSLKSLNTKIENQGGTLAPKNYFLYQDNKIEYLCYTNEFYKKCVVQKPLLKADIEKELKGQIEGKINSCLESFRNSYQGKGYTISYKKPEVSVELIPKTIVVSLNELNLKITKEKTESYKDLNIDFESKLYNFAIISSSIITSEVRYGDSEAIIYMINYPSMKVEKKKQGDGTDVYILTDKDTNEKFMFAARSLVIPPGISGN